MSDLRAGHGGAGGGSAFRCRLPHLALALGVLAADQASKLLVLARVAPNERISIVPGFFDLTHLLNSGGVWGLGRDLPAGPRLALFLVLPAGVVALAVWHALRLPAADRLRQYSLAAVLGGALGNVIDRLRLGRVVDFLLVHVDRHEWPAFNLADSAICIGIALLVLATFRFGGGEELAPEEREGGDAGLEGGLPPGAG